MRKINIKKFSTGSIIAVWIMLFVFLTVSVNGTKEFYDMRNSTEQYIICEQAARKLQKGSDTLTTDVRLFVITGQEEYMNEYFKEANVTKNRDSAVAELKANLDDNDIVQNLQNALNDSRKLMQREYVAMRLASDALNIDQSHLPTEISSVSLSAEDKGLSKQQKISKAQSMVSDSIYLNSKNEISNNVNNCMVKLVSQTENRQENSASLFKCLYFIQEIGIVLLMIFLLAYSMVVKKTIVNPLVNYNKKISKDEPIPVEGALELQSLAKTYNKVFKENQESQKIIQYKAEHDSLTNLYNKEYFNKALNSCIEKNIPFALIIADVDDFKSVNDIYGHDTGDKTLRFVAKNLRTTFNDKDYIFRIGGDEFAVIMLNTTSAEKELITQKFAVLNKNIKDFSNDIPSITLSLGVAFSEKLKSGSNLKSDSNLKSFSKESIFKNADKSLYHVKENGKNDISFFDEKTF